MNKRKFFFFLTASRPGFWNTDAPVVALEVGESGFYPIFVAEPEKFVQQKQACMSTEVLDAAIAGSMFGWDVPGAKLALECERAHAISA